MKIYLVILFVAILFTGLMSGIFFTWTNAVKPGIGLLDDPNYLASFQSMNRVILNPLFFIAFAAPAVSIILCLVFGYQKVPTSVFQLTVLAGICYIVGSIVVTILGNVPLNEILDAVDLTTINLEDSKLLRAKIESRWNGLNLIRTISSFVAFAILLLASFLR